MKVSINEVQIASLTINSNCCDVPNRFSESALKLEENKEVLDQIQNKLTRPEDLDDLTKDLGVPAILINYHLATSADLSYLNIKDIKDAVHLPLQISSREGGRRSTYKLKVGEEALVGMFITDTGILLRYIKRESGDSEFSKTGDIFTYSLKDVNGKLYYEGKGELISFTKKKGEGQIRFVQTDSDQVARTVKITIEFSAFWSMYHGKITIEIED